MDDRIAAVFDLYHARMREEEAIPHGGAAGGSLDWRDRVLL